MAKNDRNVFGNQKRIAHSGWGDDPTEGSMLTLRLPMRSWKSWLFDPFIRFEAFSTPDGKTTVGWKKVWVTSVYILLFSTFACTVFPIAAQISTSGNQAINGFVVALVGMAIYKMSLAARHTPHLPIHVNPLLTLFELMHTKFGVVIVVGYWLLQFGGLGLSLLIHNSLGSGFGDNWVTVGGLPAIGTTGAVFWTAILSGFAALVYYDQHALDYRKKSDQKSSQQMTDIGSYAIFLVRFFGWQVGCYSLNPIFYLAGAVAAGTQNSPVAGAWALYVFSPFLGAILAWIFHGPLGLWNKNALPREEIVDGVRKSTMRDGGIPHEDSARGDSDLVPGRSGATQSSAASVRRRVARAVPRR